jgi:gamma-glutamyltranspeptidase/glutathione hydrolase
MKLFAAACATMMTCACFAADLSPATWPAGDRQRAEQQEFLSWSPATPKLTSGSGGVISATVSPIAVQAGLQALRKGGTAADAAAAVALTQVATQLGSVVSYAGLMTLVYYNAKSGKVWCLDAGYGTWRGETDPKSIPPSDISALTGGAPPPPAPDLGRQTLVPGFMAGIESMQKRFGRLPLKDTLAPAIWYAESGVHISPTLAYFFQTRQKQLWRTEEGRRFLRQSGRELPLVGDLFRQPELAATLRSVAKGGARAMYTGAWAKSFVEAVRAAGGHASLEDMAAYRPQWSEAASTTVFGHQVYTNAGTSLAPYQILTALNAAEALNLQARGPYWSDAGTFKALDQLGQVVAGAPALFPTLERALKTKGVDTSPGGQRTKAYAQALATSLETLYAKSDGDTHHSNAVVVVDRDGNIAVMTHTINSVIWGDTGIVVGGIPIPDSAGFQQLRLATLKPGDRLPNEIPDLLVTKDGRPVLAGAVIGSSMVPEALRIVVSSIAQHQPLATVAAAPALLINVDPASYALPLAKRPALVPAGAYDGAFLASLRADGATVVEMPTVTVSGIRGTMALVGISGSAKSAPESPGVMVYTGAQ